VQRAFEQGRTRVNPAALLAVETNDLHRFWEHAQQKNKAAGGDSDEIGENIDKPQRRAERTPEQRDQLISRLLWGAVGVMVLAMLAGGVWLFVGDSQPRAAEVVVQTQQPEDMRDIPSSRDTLTRMGITWDENNFRSAIDRNDARVVQLFLKGGMDWKVSWTEQAHSAGNVAVLEMLMRYRLQMTQEKPCRRFITTLSHAMSSGEKLTSTRKTWLQAFCTVPAVVARQRYEVEQATRRAQAQPDASSKKWQGIQTEIYEVIR